MPSQDYGVGIQLNDDTLVLKGLDKERKPETPTNLETPFFEDHQIFKPIPPQPKSNKNDSKVTFSTTSTPTPTPGHASQSAESTISSISVGTMDRLRKGSGNAKKSMSSAIMVNDENSVFFQNTSEKMFDPEIMHRNMVVGDYSSTFLVPKPVARRKIDKNTDVFV